jgi:hypothetical protein
VSGAAVSARALTLVNASDYNFAELLTRAEVPILTKAKRPEEREFYLRMAVQQRWSVREVARQIDAALFERAVLKLNFYLEALDRDVRKPHEGPSIGVLLCASKDSEVVEYALSRSLSPALVAEYQTRLPDKKLLQTKLHEFYALTESAASREPDSDGGDA